VARTLLDPEHLALIDGGAGVSVASRDRALLPNLVRALGGRVEPSGEISVFLSGTDGASVLADLHASDTIAVVSSQPSTHRTLQLKGRGVSIAAASRSRMASRRQCMPARTAWPRCAWRVAAMRLPVSAPRFRWAPALLASRCAKARPSGCRD